MHIGLSVTKSQTVFLDPFASLERLLFGYALDSDKIIIPTARLGHSSGARQTGNDQNPNNSQYFKDSFHSQTPPPW